VPSKLKQAQKPAEALLLLTEDEENFHINVLLRIEFLKPQKIYKK
jgi:hypothetical protein